MQSCRIEGITLIFDLWHIGIHPLPLQPHKISSDSQSKYLLLLLFRHIVAIWERIQKSENIVS